MKSKRWYACCGSFPLNGRFIEDAFIKSSPNPVPQHTYWLSHKKEPDSGESQSPAFFIRVQWMWHCIDPVWSNGNTRQLCHIGFTWLFLISFRKRFDHWLARSVKIFFFQKATWILVALRRRKILNSLYLCFSMKSIFFISVYSPAQHHLQMCPIHIRQIHF